MVITDAISGVFDTIGGSFDAKYLFGVPLYGSLVHHMNGTSLIFTRIQVIHEVCVDKNRYQYGFAHMRSARVREVFSFSSI